MAELLIVRSAIKQCNVGGLFLVELSEKAQSVHE